MFEHLWWFWQMNTILEEAVQLRRQLINARDQHNTEKEQLQTQLQDMATALGKVSVLTSAGTHQERFLVSIQNVCKLIRIVHAVWCVSQAELKAQIAISALSARQTQLKEKDAELTAARTEIRQQGERIEVLQVRKHSPLKCLPSDVHT